MIEIWDDNHFPIRIALLAYSSAQWQPTLTFQFLTDTYRVRLCSADLV